MGVFKLFLDEPVVGSLGKGGRYHYEDHVLEVEWYGHKSWHSMPPKSGVVVKCRRGCVEVDVLEAPRSFGGKVLWLVGVPKAARFKSMEIYEKMLEGISGPEVKREGNQHWQIARAIAEDGRKVVLAGWVDSRIPSKQLRKMVRTLGTFAPDWYIERLLGSRWGGRS